MTPRRAHQARDEGIATVWAAAGAAVIMAALLLGLHLGAAVAARHRAEAAADLAALAAAGQAVHGVRTACRQAEVIAREMGGEITRCLLSEWDALVEVHVPVPLALPGTGPAVGRARAGPMEPDLRRPRCLPRTDDPTLHTPTRPDPDHARPGFPTPFSRLPTITAPPCGKTGGEWSTALGGWEIRW
jgi:secretion/DNA translocation related TadE-like protein